MFIDASALVAILLREPDGQAFAERVDAAARRLTSGLSAYEAAVAIARASGMPIDRARRLLTTFLDRAGVETVPLCEAEREIAFDAFDRFGKGRHPASLNMGDCFAYACAKANGAQLLYKGDDFARTDLA